MNAKKLEMNISSTYFIHLKILYFPYNLQKKSNAAPRLVVAVFDFFILEI